MEAAVGSVWGGLVGETWRWCRRCSANLGAAREGAGPAIDVCIRSRSAFLQENRIKVIERFVFDRRSSLERLPVAKLSIRFVHATDLDTHRD